MEIYSSYIDRVAEDLHKIPDIKEQINYLLSEKAHFIRIGQTAAGADMVIRWIDNEINRCEILLALPKKNNQNLSLSQVALIYIYEDKVINSINASRIAIVSGY